MNEIRVLIVDDSAVSQRLLLQSFSGLPDVRIVGSAADGHVALDRIAELDPDLVTLDVEMPGMDGVATMSAIRAADPHRKVIMISALTERGAKVTIDALAAGAADYITKPAASRNWMSAVQDLRAQLAEKINQLFPTNAGGHEAAVRGVQTLCAPPARARRVDIVAMGASTGGPNALETLLVAMRADFPVPVAIVQHMPPHFTRYFAERLSSRVQFPVREAAGGETLTPASAWLAPGDSHMVVEPHGAAVRVRLSQSEPVNSCRPSVDVLFRSVAQVYGSHALGVVLTGMGRDGLDGAKQIRNAGGQVLVQDESSSVVWGMPGSIAAAGQADRVLPLNRLAPEIDRRVCVARGEADRHDETHRHH